jgi:hypothetical protein
MVRWGRYLNVGRFLCFIFDIDDVLVEVVEYLSKPECAWRMKECYLPRLTNLAGQGYRSFFTLHIAETDRVHIEY